MPARITLGRFHLILLYQLIGHFIFKLLEEQMKPSSKGKVQWEFESQIVNQGPSGCDGLVQIGLIFKC